MLVEEEYTGNAEGSDEHDGPNRDLNGDESDEDGDGGDHKPHRCGSACDAHEFGSVARLAARWGLRSVVHLTAGTAQEGMRAAQSALGTQFQDRRTERLGVNLFSWVA